MCILRMYERIRPLNGKESHGSYRNFNDFTVLGGSSLVSLVRLLS